MKFIMHNFSYQIVLWFKLVIQLETKLNIQIINVNLHPDK